MIHGWMGRFVITHDKISHIISQLDTDKKFIQKTDIKYVTSINRLLNHFLFASINKEAWVCGHTSLVAHYVINSRSVAV